MNEGTCGRRTIGMECGRIVDKTPLHASSGCALIRLNPDSKAGHVTEVIGKMPMQREQLLFSRMLPDQHLRFGIARSGWR